MFKEIETDLRNNIDVIHDFNIDYDATTKVENQTPVFVLQSKGSVKYYNRNKIEKRLVELGYEIQVTACTNSHLNIRLRKRSQTEQPKGSLVMNHNDVEHLNHEQREIVTHLNKHIQEAIKMGEDHLLTNSVFHSSEDAAVVRDHLIAKGYTVKITRGGFFGTGMHISGFNSKPTNVTEGITIKSINAKDTFNTWASEPNSEQLKNGLSLKEMVAVAKPTVDLTAIMQSIRVAISTDKPNVQINLAHVTKSRRDKLTELGYTVTVVSNNSTVIISGW